LTGLAAPSYQQARQRTTGRPTGLTALPDKNGENTSLIQSHHEWLLMSE